VLNAACVQSVNRPILVSLKMFNNQKGDPEIYLIKFKVFKGDPWVNPAICMKEFKGSPSIVEHKSDT